MPMSSIDFTEISSAVESWTSSDKLRLIRVLVDSLEKDGVQHPRMEATYPIWSPIEAHEAAAVMMQFIESQRAK
jgi:hypothetical protein